MESWQQPFDSMLQLERNLFLFPKSPILIYSSLLGAIRAAVCNICGFVFKDNLPNYFLSRCTLTVDYNKIMGIMWIVENGLLRIFYFYPLS